MSKKVVLFSLLVTAAALGAAGMNICHNRGLSRSLREMVKSDRWQVEYLRELNYAGVADLDEADDKVVAAELIVVHPSFSYSKDSEKVFELMKTVGEILDEAWIDLELQSR